MNINEYLSEEYVPALGCTEPACIAYAGLTAANELSTSPTRAKLTVDPRMYKNCYAVGIPHSDHKTGIKWATAIGAFLKSSAKLECFKDIDEEVLNNAENLINSGEIDILIDNTKDNLFVLFELENNKEQASCTIEGAHTNITKVIKNCDTILENKKSTSSSKQNSARSWANSLSIAEIVKFAKSIDDSARAKIRDGSKLNLKIAEYGLTLFPKNFVEMTSADPLARIAGLVCAGVYARMCGEDFPVMSVAGSGNKGITMTVPLITLEKEWNIEPKKMEEALLIAMLFTSKTTEELGTLSAVCGCSNAAGIGLACALVYLQNGGEEEISHAINNMVGNVTGMICDGAKIGCALKTMTAVDAAFRASVLAINGIGIPIEDGIVGKNGNDSLFNMGEIAKKGMIKTDEEILNIMKSKL